jgi:hypothetical protein
MGYDNSKWFRTVENATLPFIGQETVKVVSDLNKYYLAYVLAEKLRNITEQKKGQVEVAP